MLRVLALLFPLLALAPVADAKPDEDKKPKKQDVIDVSEAAALLLFVGGAAAVAGVALFRRRRSDCDEPPTIPQ